MRPLLLAATVLIAAAPVPPASSADTAFRAIWSDEWGWRQQERIDDGDPNEVSPHLPDISATAHARRLARWQETLRRLDAIDAQRLSPEVRIDYQVYRQQIAAIVKKAR